MHKKYNWKTTIFLFGLLASVVSYQNCGDSQGTNSSYMHPVDSVEQDKSTMELEEMIASGKVSLKEQPLRLV